jgi:adenylate kinase
VFALLIPAVAAAARHTGGYLLDGIPRTLAQARRLAEIVTERDLVTDAVVYLTAPDAVLVARLLDRADRESRADDRPDVIRHRLEVFDEDTAPVVGYYQDRGVLIEVDADRPVAVIRADLRQRLADRGLLATSAS